MSLIRSHPPSASHSDESRDTFDAALPLNSKILVSSVPPSARTSRGYYSEILFSDAISDGDWDRGQVSVKLSPVKASPPPVAIVHSSSL